MLTLMKLLKELTLSAMHRLCDDFCAMLLRTLSIKRGSVIRNVVPKNFWGFLRPYDPTWGKALKFHKHSIFQSFRADKPLQHPCLKDLLTL